MSCRERIHQAFVVGSVSFGPVPLQKVNYSTCPQAESKEDQKRGERYEQMFEHAGRAQEMGVTEATVDPAQLAAGIEVEKEHTTDPEIAKRIALDHLAEISDYYTRLKKMEDDAKAKE